MAVALSLATGISFCMELHEVENRINEMNGTIYTVHCVNHSIAAFALAGNEDDQKPFRVEFLGFGRDNANRYVPCSHMSRPITGPQYNAIFNFLEGANLNAFQKASAIETALKGLIDNN